MEFLLWIKTHVLYLLLLLATVFGYFCLSENRKRLGIKEPMAFLLAVLHTVIGLFSVKAFAFLESGNFSGMSLYGAVLFLPVVYYTGAKLTKRRVADVFDVFTFLTVFTLMLARLNCLYAGCCLGKLVPWSDSFRWPTRELEIVFYVVLLFWLGRLSKKPHHSGKIYPLYMLSYGIFRFVVEWFRESENTVGFAHLSHIWSLVAIAVGTLILVLLNKKPICVNKRHIQSDVKAGKIQQGGKR